MQNKAIPNNLKDVNQWLRILYMLLFAVIFNVATAVLWVVVLVQALFSLLTGSSNANVKQLGSGLTQFILQIMQYLTYQSEEKPFPFQAWPEVEAVSEVPAAEPVEAEKATAEKMTAVEKKDEDVAEGQQVESEKA